jgi:hypothetical protein
MIKQRYKEGGIMINIRPVSDLRNNIKQYSALTDGIEHKLDEADKSDVRYSASKVFGKVRSRINEHEKA